MTTRTAADEDARQPLLSDTDHDHHADPEQPNNDSTPAAAKKDVQPDWHWLEKLVFGTRLRFFISLGIFFVSWVVIAIAADGGRLPWNGGRWPWTKEPERYYTPEFSQATQRLQNQPFCLPQ